MSHEDTIDASIAWWRRGELQRALPGLLEVWAATRSPVLADRIDLLSRALTPQLPPVDFSGAKSVSGTLEKALEASTWLEVGPLIEAISRAIRTAPAQYVLMVKLAHQHLHDPRLARALNQLVLKPPFINSTGALYGDTVSALEALDDPRFLPSLIAWSQALELRRRYIRRERGDLDRLRDIAIRLGARGYCADAPGVPDGRYERAEWLTGRLLEIPEVKVKVAQRDLNALLKAIMKTLTILRFGWSTAML
jgi:hypothetical protein